MGNLKHRKYTPVEVCEIFDVSKSSLFRWEEDGVIPPVGRDERNQRVYTHEHVEAISRRQTELLRKRYEAASNTEDQRALMEVSEANALRKFIAGNMTGLQEMERFPSLSPRTIRQLLRVASDEQGHSDELFRAVIKVLWVHTSKPAVESFTAA